MGRPSGMWRLVQPMEIAIFLSFCILAIVAETDPDIVFDDALNAIKLDADNPSKNHVKPLTSPLLRDERRSNGFFDDEDLYGDSDGPSGDDFGITGSGDGADVTPAIPTVEVPPGQPLYMRAMFVIINLQYRDPLADPLSVEFRRDSSNVVLQLRSLFSTLEEVEEINVSSFQLHPRGTLVTADILVHSPANQTKLAETLRRAVNQGFIGGLRTLPHSATIKFSGEDTRPRLCGEDELECRSGGCYHKDRHCDGHRDCSDGSDEYACREIVCPSGEIQCDGVKCIHQNKICDGVRDCNDGTDEADCVKECRDNEFQCGDGTCVPYGRCNGRVECNDGSDERNCRPICKPTDFVCEDNTGCVNQTHKCDGRYDCADGSDEAVCKLCEILEFACNNKECIPRGLRCDQRPDCPDGEDEAECDERCPRDEHECDNGRCIAKSLVCNGQFDCYDRTDEADCEAVLCPSGQWKCRNGQCIDARLRCNLRSDCSDASDEADCADVRCPSGQWRCRSGQCIDARFHCNRRIDCTDSSDEAECADLPCPPGQWKCRNGQCIDARLHCNGRADCADSSDEAECADIPCPTGYWRCRNGQCIDAEAHCDGRPDCADFSDEAECADILCPTGQWRCRNGQCIDARRHCDRRADCADSSDEAECPDILCPTGQWTCRNGQCIDARRHCDGRPDCADSSDEAECPDILCRPDQWRCRNGQCIDRRAHCDGRVDCADSSDEAECPDILCRPDQWRCRNGQCIDRRAHCDGRVDCADSSDEAECPDVLCRPDQWRCRNGQCIERQAHCDGRVDCADSSDEAECADVVCPSGRWKCRSGHCIDAEFRCNRRPDCPDGSDEHDCAEVRCPHGQWRCRSGQCIDVRYHCNGVIDCADSSDEAECDEISCPSGQWQCRNGQCIDHQFRCNGRIDCYDQTDEEDCEPETDTDVKVYPERQRIRQGREVVFRCRDEGRTRFPVRWSRMDETGSQRALPPGSTDVRGRLTMPNIQPTHGGAYVCRAIGPVSGTATAQKVAYLVVDPYIPPATRPPVSCNPYDSSTCRNGECIPKSYVCDGDYDCTDRSDEINCAPPHCEPNEFQCENQKCILKVWRCDGDNDCEDNSDEKYCTSTPGSPCHYGEYKCASGDQCIPKSFQCDSEFDCQDNSDEIGCAPPTITQPPPETLTVEEGGTVTITCVAVGTPTPVISWRLNWGHVPQPPRVVVTSENGKGTITIHDARPSDQGAWSCEAINSKDSVLAIPDCIIIVKSKEGICQPPLFNEKAESPAECLRCFCFGITDTCYSSSLRLDTIPLRTEISVVALQKDYAGQYIDVSQRYPPNQNAVQYFSPTREYRIDSSVKSGRVPLDVHYFWSLPPDFLRNQLKSYGGYIRYTFRYTPVSTGSQPQRLVDVVVKGNNITLYHIPRQMYVTNRDNKAEVHIWEGNWYRSEARGSTDIPVHDTVPVTRTEILTALQNVEAIYVRATYSEEFRTSSISQFEMDTASISKRDSSQAVFVEKCSCPEGYVGDSCESCAVGYVRTPGGHLGQCISRPTPCDCHRHSTQCDALTGECMNCGHNTEGRHCERCKRGFYGDARRGTPNDCQPCPCPLITPSQLVPTCHLDAEGQVACDACPIGYEGKRCERCAPGYHRDSGAPEGSCIPIGKLHCDLVGSVSREPSNITGLCQCKPHVTGEKCDQCKTNTFHLHRDSPYGCVECFCMAVTSECRSSDWHRDQESMNPITGYSGVILTDSVGKYKIESNFQSDFNTRALLFRNFGDHPTQTYYWQLPSRFLGDKVTAYGGKFNYTIMYVSPTSARANTDPDVKIMGNEIVLVYQHPRPLRANVAHSVSISMYETSWRREDGHPVPREIFLMALADLDEILIKATYTLETSSASLIDINMDIAKEEPTGQERAFAVEQCRCPIGYTGLSCEDCDSGYTRSKTGIYLGLCEACFCNGHSSDCDPENGFCRNCLHNTVGDFCEECKPGFYGDATNGTPNDCQPAVEPPCQCDIRGSLGFECDFRTNCPCKTHVQGRNCNRCKEGYFNLETRNPEGCTPCFCFGVTQQCSSSSYYRSQIHMRLKDLSDPYLHSFELTDRYREYTITEDIVADRQQNEVSYGAFSQANIGSKRLFWSLPAEFLGNKLASYGGKLRYSQVYTTGDGGDIYSDADIQITGNGIVVYYVNSPTLRPLENKTYEIEFKETNWQRVDSRGPTSASREDFMRVLANIEVFLIRASFHSEMRRSILRNVILDTAVPQSTGQSAAVEVEQCVCPPGYAGLSCEECAPGYIRDASGPGLGRCTRCSCNGHSESCDANTGRCIRCRHNTMGDSCEKCIDGYYGDPRRGTPEDCKPCPCPLTSPSNQFSPTCRLDTDGHPTCTACKPGYDGRNCERCSPGYRGDPVQPGGKCEFEGIRPPIQARIEEPKIQRVLVGTTVTFRCTAVSPSTTPPQIVWTKGGGLPPQATEASGVLTIPNVRPEDTGIYTCTVSDYERVSQDQATLTVEATGRPTLPKVHIQPSFQTVRVGEPVEFRCIAEGFPQPRLHWTSSQNNRLNTQSTFADGIFRIPAASLSDQSEYYCIATNSAGTESARAVLRVEGEEPEGRRPELTISPSTYEAQRGETVSFDCQVAGIPAPTIRWTFSGGRLPEGTSQIRGTLTIPTVNESHQGVYICTASNIHGTSQAQAQLLISTRRVAPTVRIEPESQIAVKGQTAELHCVATGTPTPVIRWKKSGEELSPRHKVQGSRLIIEDVVIEDRGYYTCFAENRDGTAQASARFEVEVREIPSIELYPSPSQVVQFGEAAFFQCRANGAPTPTVEWTRADGSPFSSATELIQGTVIRFHRVTTNEEGVYICTAENTAGKVTADASLRIQGFPTLRILQKGPYTARPGESVVFECIATGEPKPTLVWRKLHQPLRTTGEEGVARLRIDRVTLSDSGVYICSAQTAAGTSEEQIQLIVEDIRTVPPEVYPAEEVETANVGSRVELRCIVRAADIRDIHLRWERADGRPITSDHTIHNGVLTINNVQPEDAGEYSCLGISGSRHLFTSKIRLAIVAPPEVVLNPVAQSAKPGDVVRFHCTATGDQLIAIHWSRPGGYLGRNVVQQDGLLEFRGVTLDDAGQYVCTAVNAAGRTKGTASLSVNEQVITERKEETRPIGSNIELRCPITGFPNPLIEWSKDGGPLPDNARQVNNDLRIHNIQPSNAGRYYCTATSSAGRTQDYITLHVKDIPTIEIKIEASKEIVHPGDTLHLRCRVKGDPSAKIQWSKLGLIGPLPDNAAFQGSLVIINGVSSQNGGVYRCTVESYMGTKYEDYLLAIQVPPSIPPYAVVTKVAPFGHNVVLNCTTNLDPPVEYTWSKQGGFLPPHSYTSHNYLEIRNITAAAAGTYICTARSNVGTLEIPTILVVTGVVPRFTQTPSSFLRMDTLSNVYQSFEIEISFKPESPEGLLLYNGNKKKDDDFVSLGLKEGHVELRYNLGSGVAVLQSSEPLEMGKWHTVHVIREGTKGILNVNDGIIVNGSAPGTTVGLDLDEPLYIGSVPDFRSISRHSGFSTGFIGCISQFHVGSIEYDLLREGSAYGVISCDTCEVNQCEHSGVCQPALTKSGFECICPAGFSGERCEKITETCYPGVCGEGRCVNSPGGGFECFCPFGRTGLRCQKEILIVQPAFSDDAYAAYPIKNVSNYLKLDMKVKLRRLDDGVIAYSAQNPNGIGDFVSLAVRNKSLEFQFDSGSGPALLKSPQRLQADQWVLIVAERSGQQGALTLNNGTPVTGSSPGFTRGLDLGTSLYIGGFDRERMRVSQFVGVTHGFDGCIAHIEVNAAEIDFANAVVDSANVKDCGGALTCSDSPCLNNGICREEPDGYICECKEGYTGINCETESEMCELLEPCKNSGTCEDVGGTYKCHCSLKYTGRHCEEVNTFSEEAMFEGDGYLSLSQSYLPRASVASVNVTELISFSFLTEESEGLLLFQGQKPHTDGKGADYLALAVVDGYLEFSYQLGSGPAEILSGTKVDDGKEHTVELRRKGSYGLLNVDNVDKQEGYSQGSLQMLNAEGDIYIGGVPNYKRMTDNRYRYGFHGCIWDVKIQNSDRINLFEEATSGRNVKQCPNSEIYEASGESSLEDHLDALNLIQK